MLAAGFISSAIGSRSGPKCQQIGSLVDASGRRSIPPLTLRNFTHLSSIFLTTLELRSTSVSLYT